MILIGADEQAGREAVEAAFRGLTGCLKQPHLIAFDAPSGNIRGNLPDKRTQTVVVALNQGQVDGGGIFSNRIAPGPVLGKGVDIGIIPESRDLKTVGAQNLNGLIGAGRAADMKQRFHSSSKSKQNLNYYSISWVFFHFKVLIPQKYAPSAEGAVHFTA